MSTANEHVFSHGMRDTREALEAWSERPLGGPARLAGAQPGDRAGAAGGGLGRRRAADAGHHADPPAGPDRTVGARRPAADPLAQLAGPRPARDRLRRRLHRRRLDADRRRPAHRLLALDPRQGGRAGDPLRLRGHPLLALAPRRSTSASRARRSPTSCTSPTATLILSVLPHALPELTALFLPLAAWLIASRRGEWNQLLAATFVTVADRDPGPDRRGDDRGLRLAPHPRSASRRSYSAPTEPPTALDAPAHKIAGSWRIRPEGDRAQVAAGLGRGEDLGGRQPRPARLRRLEAEVLRAGDAALPLGRAPRRPPQVLRGRRRDRPLPPPPRLRGDPPDGLRLLRPAGREQRDQDRRAAAGGDRALDRVLPAPVPRVGDLDRLVARARHPHARVLPLDPVDLPAAVRARPRLPRPRRRCSGARRTPPCSPTSRSSTAAASAAAPRSCSASSSSGSSRSPTTPSACSPTSTCSSPGPST